MTAPLERPPKATLAQGPSRRALRWGRACACLPRRHASGPCVCGLSASNPTSPHLAGAREGARARRAARGAGLRRHILLLPARAVGGRRRGRRRGRGARRRRGAARGGVRRGGRAVAPEDRDARARGAGRHVQVGARARARGRSYQYCIHLGGWLGPGVAPAQPSSRARRPASFPGRRAVQAHIEEGSDPARPRGAVRQALCAALQRELTEFYGFLAGLEQQLQHPLPAPGGWRGATRTARGPVRPPRSIADACHVPDANRALARARPAAKQSRRSCLPHSRSHTPAPPPPPQYPPTPPLQAAPMRRSCRRPS